ncbi:Glycerol-3-phosphate/dihydroxyacetone phosphate acyltransferase, partial [Elasticomyces elasticus]
MAETKNMSRKPDGTRMLPWAYDTMLWCMSVLIDLFFREVHPRGAWRVPRSEPIILVAAPHANQFVDSLILMHIMKHETRRRISYLIAAHSTKRKVIGTLSRVAGAIPVGRALDQVKSAEGKIFLPDQDNDPTLVRGVGTDFKNGDFEIGGLIVLPKIGNQTPSTEIVAVISATELRLKKPFKTPEAVDMLTGSNDDTETGESRGTKFKVAPHIDQSKVYDEVFQDLNAGGCIGIFPEGGSHDRTDLLPLKAGVAIMALGAMAQKADCNIKIIPVGMNYFHAHKFRSRAVIEFGHPIEVHPDQIEAYKNGDRRNAVGSLLETVYQGLLSVTQTSPDYETLMLAQAARRLYNPHGKKLPLPTVVELNRRLVKGYTEYKDDPRVVELKKEVLDYNRRLRAMHVADHQIEWGDARRRWWYIAAVLIYRIGEVLVLFAGCLPGLAMFWPVFVTTKIISVKKSREALAASTVKLQGKDVITTWKLLVAMALAPALYIYYDVIVKIWLWYNRNDGYYTYVVPWWLRTRSYVPDLVPLWMFSVFSFILYIMLTMAALRIGEVGMDILKSLPPLFVALDPRTGNTLMRLRQRREDLAKKVTALINEIGPKVYPDFDAERIVEDPYKEGAYQSSYREMGDAIKSEDLTEASTPTT